MKRYQLDRVLTITVAKLRTLKATNIRTRLWLDGTNQPRTLTFSTDHPELVSDFIGCRIWCLTDKQWYV